jgi:hypothetical protein
MASEVKCFPGDWRSHGLEVSLGSQDFPIPPPDVTWSFGLRAARCKKALSEKVAGMPVSGDSER